MSRMTAVKPVFSEFIPERLDQGTLYVSMKYATAAHLCCCGCGMKVVTPLTPTDWTLTFDGESVTLHPSIGNWGFQCQSHYWIRENRIVWAPRWTKADIDAGRSRDRRAKEAYYEDRSRVPIVSPDRGNKIVEWLKSLIERR